jgi:hypothetical protein
LNCPSASSWMRNLPLINKTSQKSTRAGSRRDSGSSV